MYGTHVLEALEDDTPRLEGCHVLQEFRDVFPDKVLSIPPNRDIYFTIELVPGKAPVSTTRYKVSTPKRIEMKMQLE